MVAIVVDWPALLLAGGALLTALATAYKNRADAGRAARRDDLDALRLTVDELQEENRELRQQNKQIRRELDEMRRARAVLTQRISEMVVENERLHQYIGELREKMQEGRIAPRVLAVMRRVPEMSVVVGEMMAGESLTPELRERLEDLLSIIQSLPAMVRDVRDGGDDEHRVRHHG